MEDSNHAPLTERERLAGIIRKVLSTNANAWWMGEETIAVCALAAADAILSDPTYAKAAEQLKALKAAEQYLVFNATDECQPYPLAEIQRALNEENK